jgi:hypothetical protein
LNIIYVYFPLYLFCCFDTVNLIGNHNHKQKHGREACMFQENKQSNLLNDRLFIKGHFLKLSEQCKGKSIPLQVWTGPEDSRRLRLPEFNTVGT